MSPRASGPPRASAAHPRASAARPRGLREEDLRRRVSDPSWRPSPVIYLWSEDHFLLRRAARSVARRALESSARPPEHHWAADEDLGTLFGSARSPGLFDAPGERRVAFVHDADRVPGARQEAFLREIAIVPDDVCLILLARVREPDERRSPAFHDKLLRAAGESFLLYAPSGAELKRWLEGLAKEKGLRLTEAARDRLLRVSGTSLAQIEGELEKLAVVHGKGGATIGEDALSAAAERGYRVAPSDFSEAFGAGDVAGALRALEECERAGFHALDLVRDLAQYAQMLLAVREALGPSPDPGSVFRLTHAVWPRCVTASKHAGRYEPRVLSRLLVRLADVERGEKSGREEAHKGLERLLLERLAALTRSGTVR